MVQSSSKGLPFIYCKLLFWLRQSHSWEMQTITQYCSFGSPNSIRKSTWSPRRWHFDWRKRYEEHARNLVQFWLGCLCCHWLKAWFTNKVNCSCKVNCLENRTIWANLSRRKDQKLRPYPCNTSLHFKGHRKLRIHQTPAKHERVRINQANLHSAFSWSPLCAYAGSL